MTVTRSSGDARAVGDVTSLDHDHQIRSLLLPALRARAQWVCEEFSVDGRVDVATIEEGRLCGYEIKAARDSLARLFTVTDSGFTQVDGFSRALDRVTVVCVAKHAPRLVVE